MSLTNGIREISFQMLPDACEHSFPKFSLTAAYCWTKYIRFTETYLAKEIDSFIETVEKKHEAHIFMMVGFPDRSRNVEMTT